MAPQAELCNRALRRFIELCYAETEAEPRAGGPDAAPTLWSRTRYAAYGLTDHGSRVLRALVVAQFERQAPSRRLLRYGAGRWAVNLGGYPHLPAALGWLEACAVTPDGWLRANDGLRRRGRKGGR